MHIILNKNCNLDQRLDRVQRYILGSGFIAYLTLYAATQNVKSEVISAFPQNLIALPFALLSFCILFIAFRRYRYAKAISTHAKLKNQALYNSLREQSTKANYDELTGFPNKRLLEDRFGEAVNRAKREKSLVLLYRVTLPDFHSLVVNQGAAVGAEFIKIAGERLGSVLRSTDTIVRLGSCEFVLIIESIDNPEGVVVLNKKIMKQLGEKITLECGNIIVANEKVAVARYPWDGVTLDALMTAAVDKLEQGRKLPRWVDALAAKLTDISPSQFASLS